MNTIDNKFMSYLIGLMQTDGTLHETTRNRGRASVELSYKDKDIINKISGYLDCNYSIKERTKDTIFLDNYKSIILLIYDLEFRNVLKEWGMISGHKSNDIKMPTKKELDKIEYIRGLYDGDGSLGFTSNKFPFVSFTTKSNEIKNMLIEFISEITNKPKKNINRNKRDNIYNISIFKEDAILFCEKIYFYNCISIDRKYNLAQEIKKWERPANMRKNKKWG